MNLIILFVRHQGRRKTYAHRNIFPALLQSTQECNKAGIEEGMNAEWKEGVDWYLHLFWSIIIDATTILVPTVGWKMRLESDFHKFWLSVAV